jgi:hypothetical protein
MIVNGTEYGISIFPCYGKVQAEIYKVSEMMSGKNNIHLRMLNKEFGSMFRTPNENDYKKAREWADLQMKCILDANS